MHNCSNYVYLSQEIDSVKKQKLLDPLNFNKELNRPEN